MTTFAEKILATHHHLREGGIVHAFGGAIALGYHVAAPRATVDIDVNISVEPASARRALQALPPEIAWTAADVAQVKRDGQTRLLWERTPVDLFFPQHDLHEVVARRVQHVPFVGATIPVVSATDLAVFKTLFNRPKDWVDIDEMLAYGSVDRAEARSWLVRLLGDDDPRVARLDAIA